MTGDKLVIEIKEGPLMWQAMVGKVPSYGGFWPLWDEHSVTWRFTKKGAEKAGLKMLRRIEAQRRKSKPVRYQIDSKGEVI